LNLELEFEETEMKRFLTAALVAALTCLGATAAMAAHPASPADESQDVLQADHAFEQTFEKADRMAAGKLLDADFTWTDYSGKIATKPQVLKSLAPGAGPKPALAGSGASVKEYTYGQVAVVQVNSGTMHVLRVWVKRPAGWQALVYQEVKSLDAPPTVTPGAGKVCINPCKSVPFKPNNAAEKAVIESYMGLETSAVARNASDWSAHTATEFVAASSNSNVLLDKPTRLVGLRKEKMAGLSPTPLTTCRMFTFGDAVVMISLHKPVRGKSLHVTRVWVKRNGNWVETLSYQTSIQGGPAIASK
jgi:Domain of unknown function (DUF4440)